MGGALGRRWARLAPPSSGGGGSLPLSLRIQGSRLTPKPFLLAGLLKGVLSLLQTSASTQALELGGTIYTKFSLCQGGALNGVSASRQTLTHLPYSNRLAPPRRGTASPQHLPFMFLNKASSSRLKPHSGFYNEVPDLSQIFISPPRFQNWMSRSPPRPHHRFPSTGLAFPKLFICK